MKLVPTFLILLILIIGCSENQNITSPIDDAKFEKITDPNDPNYLERSLKQQLLDVEPQWVTFAFTGNR